MSGPVVPMSVPMPVSMSELLAACAAARAVSQPPRAPELKAPEAPFRGAGNCATGHDEAAAA